ncbi:MAG: hypothetical protein KKH01_09715, partial [Firmicutes bacterium]|nr:hypothetical protein [Bacillota bacterium]
KQQKKELEQEYISLFGGQIYSMKSLYKTNADEILFDELLENVSASLYQVMQQKRSSKAEALVERMYLSSLEYDVLLMSDHGLDEYEADIYFYNDFKLIEYTEIRIKNAYDVKKLLVMIMHVGKKYDLLMKNDLEAEKFITDYQLLDGIDKNYLLEMNEEFISKKALN